jgi:hypothetical protein
MYMLTKSTALNLGEKQLQPCTRMMTALRTMAIHGPQGYVQFLNGRR